MLHTEAELDGTGDKKPWKSTKAELRMSAGNARQISGLDESFRFRAHLSGTGGRGDGGRGTGEGEKKCSGL